MIAYTKVHSKSIWHNFNFKNITSFFQFSCSPIFFLCGTVSPDCSKASNWLINTFETLSKKANHLN